MFKKSKAVIVFAVAALALAGCASSGDSANGPATAETVATEELVWYFERTYREVIDVGVSGDSHGDITVTNGGVSSELDGEVVGSYATTQISARVGKADGSQDRKTDISVSMDGSTIYTTSLVTATPGTPPTEKTAHAIVGGTGTYAGARGEMILEPLSAESYKVTFYFIK